MFHANTLKEIIDTPKAKSSVSTDLNIMSTINLNLTQPFISSFSSSRAMLKITGWTMVGGQSSGAASYFLGIL